MRWTMRWTFFVPRLLTPSVAFIALLCLSCAGKSTPAKVVAIATLMSHPALDQVEAGIKAELAARGHIEGTNVRYIERSANGQVQLAATIASEINAMQPDIAVGITTPIAQSLVKNPSCPVVFAAVTDPVGAGIVKSLDTGEGAVTGTSDAWPYQEQLKLIRAMLPNARRLAVLYNPGEAASQYGILKIRTFAPQYGFTLVEGAVSTTSEVFPVASNLVRKVDALFLSSDNTVIGGVAGAVKVAVEHKVPLFVGDSGTVEKGGLAAVSVGYEQLGRDTGVLVDRMLKGERNIPTVIATGADIYINLKSAELMGVTVPDSLVRAATKTFDAIKQ